jgi:hypothetical protein
MSRLNTRLWLIVPVLLLAVIAVACGGGGEEKTLLNKYFLASKLADNLTLANIATISFDPKTDGQMQSFSVLSVSEPTSTPLELKAHAAELQTVIGEEKAFTARKKAYQDENTEAIDRIMKAEAKKQTIKGKDADVLKEWNKFLEEQAVISKKLSEARRHANEGRGLVEISIQDQREPIDVTAFEGVINAKDVTVEGQVKPETGDAVTKKFVFTLKQAILKNVNGKDREGRWVVTDRKDVQ